MVLNKLVHLTGNTCLSYQYLHIFNKFVQRQSPPTQKTILNRRFFLNGYESTCPSAIFRDM